MKEKREEEEEEEKEEKREEEEDRMKRGEATKEKARETAPVSLHAWLLQSVHLVLT